MHFSDFVAGYRAGTVRVHIDRSRAMHVCDKHPSLPKRYRAAHSLWKNIGFFLIVGGLVSLFWVPWWAGLGAALLGVIMAPAVQKSASQFVLQHSLEDEAFFTQMLEVGVLKVEQANADV